MKPSFNYILLILLFLSLPLHSDESLIKRRGFPFIKNFKPADYGQFSQNWSIEQDLNGVLYFGNQFGLLSYDGSNWTLTKTSNSAAVNSMDLDSKGTLFIGSNGEFGYVKTSKGKNLKYVSLLNKIDKKERNFRNVWSTIVVGDSVYFFTYKRIFHYNRGKISVIKKRIFPAFTRKVFNRIFVISQKLEILILKEDKFIKLPYTNKIRKQLLNPLVLPYLKDRILIATCGGKFFTYDLSRVYNFEKDTLNPRTFSENSIVQEFPTDAAKYLSLKSGLLTSGMRVDNQTYALTSARGGIILFDINGIVTNKIDKECCLQDNAVWGIFMDREKNLWAALNNGISRIDINSPVTHFNNKNGIDEFVTTITKHQSFMFAGTFNGVYRHNLKANKNIFQKIKNYPGDCWSFITYKDALLFGGTIGIYQLSAQKTLPVYRCLNVYSLGKTNKFPSYIFVGKNSGLEAIKLKEKNGKISSDPKTKISYKYLPYSIREIVTDKAGDLWLTTSYNGIILLTLQKDSPEKYKIYRYTVENGLPELSQNGVKNINGEILITTKNGVYKPDWSDTTGRTQLQKLKFVKDQSFDKRLPKKNEQVTCIIPHDDKLYIKTPDDFGISYKKNGKYVWDNIPFRKINGFVEHIYIEDNGNCWFAGPDGLQVFNNQQQKDYTLPFETLIREVKAYGKPFKTSSKSTLLLKPANSISFDFAALFFEKSQNNLFSYKLEGYENNWSEWAKLNHSKYTNLPAGEYTFKVKSKNIYNNEGDPDCFNFNVAPPWFKTTAAYISYATLIVLLTISGILLYRRHIKNIINRERKRYELPEDLSQLHINKIVESMEIDKEYLNTSLSLNTLAKKLSIPGYQLSLVLNRELGCSFYEFVNKYRINEAKKLLIDSKNDDLSILEISYQAGFNTKSTFNKAFKKFAGCTPIQYKKRNRPAI